MTKTTAIAGLAVLCGLAAPAGAQSPVPAGGSVPVTKILAIGRVSKTATREKIMPMMRQEVRDTVQLYLAGKLEQWYSRKDQNGVVFILNAASVDQAKGILEKLPLVEGQLLEFELIPLGPLSPLSVLLGDSASPAKP